MVSRWMNGGTDASANIEPEVIIPTSRARAHNLALTYTAPHRQEQPFEVLFLRNDE